MKLTAALKDDIAAHVAAGLNNIEIAALYESSEASVRRFKTKYGLVSPENAPETEKSVLARAERQINDQATIEDALRDDVDHLTAENRRLTSVVKDLRNRVRVEDRIVGAIRYEMSESQYITPIKRVPPLVPGKETRGQHFVALVSDAHGGEIVDAEEALGISYNWDICVRRIEYIRDMLIKYRDLRPYTVTKLWVPVLGDMLSGNIHEELEITNAMPLPEQAMEMGKVLFQMGADLSEYFPEVEMVVMPGNHPRLKKKPSNKQKYSGWEFVMGQFTKGLAEASGINNFTVDVPKDLVKVIDVLGYRIGLMHGDGVKSNSFAGIPFYGLKQRREALQSLLSQVGQPRLDMLAMGHFHQYVYWRGECDVIINPSIKGGDEYSIANYLAIHKPEQVLLEYHPEHGLTSQNLISLGHIN